MKRSPNIPAASDYIAPKDLPTVRPRVLTFTPDNEAGEHFDFHIDRL